MHRCAVIIVGLLSILAIAAQEPVAVPWSLQGPKGNKSGSLAATGGGVIASDEAGPYLAIAANPGRRTTITLGASTPLPLQPLHMYRLTARLRCPPRMRVLLRTDEAAVDMPLENPRILPATDYFVAPIWEDITGFFILPPGPAGRALTLIVDNAPDGRGDWHVGLRNLRLEDLGEVRTLRRPKLIGSWSRIELTDPLKVVPRVTHDGGSGTYVVRAAVQAPEATRLTILLEQGDEPRYHWWRSSGLVHTVEVAAGESHIECVFHVADRRFVHQWLRFAQKVSTPPAVLQDLELLQLAEEPPAAAQAGLQSPSRR